VDSRTEILFSLMLSGTFIWGIFETFQSYYLRTKSIPEPVMIVGSCSGTALFAILAELFWNGTSTAILSDFWLPFIATCLLNIVMVRFKIAAMKLEDLSIVAPLSVITPFFVLILSLIVVGERVYPVQGAGIVLLGIGSYLLRLGGDGVALPVIVAKVVPVGWHKPVIFCGSPMLRLFSSRGARLALGVAIIASVALYFDKLATINSNPMIFTGAVYLVVALVAYVPLRYSHQWATFDKRHFAICFLLGFCLDGAASILVNAGYFFGAVPVVGSLKRLYAFFAVLFAGIFLKEQHIVTRVIASLFIWAGVTLIGLK
jgi:uncharacterized membrane protein